MQDLDVDKPEHHDENHRKHGEQDDVAFAPVKDVFQHRSSPFITETAVARLAGGWGLRRTDNRPYDTHLPLDYNKNARHINTLTNFNGLGTGSGAKK
jgi:hypothetical protein